VAPQLTDQIHPADRALGGVMQDVQTNETQEDLAQHPSAPALISRTDIGG
jgi:hypothetical protein